MKKFLIPAIGFMALAYAFSLNFRNAYNDYGVKTNKLHVEVLAQTGSTGDGTTGDGTSGGGTSGGGTSGGGTTGGGTGDSKPKIKICRPVACTDTWVGQVSLEGCITILGVKLCGFAARTTITHPYSGHTENCTGGSDWEDCDACVSKCVPDPK